MNKINDEYIDTLNIISKQYADRICDGEKKSQIIKEQLSCIEDLQNSKNNLIKYLEDMIKDCDYQIDIIGNYQKICEKRAYRDILERVKSGKYD